MVLHLEDEKITSCTMVGELPLRHALIGVLQCDAAFSWRNGWTVDFEMSISYFLLGGYFCSTKQHSETIQFDFHQKMGFLASVQWQVRLESGCLVMDQGQGSDVLT
jgi:hypothetical protein